MLMAERCHQINDREIKLPLFPGFTEHARETLLNYRWREICVIEKRGGTFSVSSRGAAIIA